MPSFRHGVLALVAVSTATLFGSLPALAQGPVHTPRVHALVGARIVQAPGRVIEDGTVVIRDGVIEAVGPKAKVTIPPDARVWEMDSLTVYPGLIDLGMVVQEGGGGGGRGGGGQGEEAKKAEAGKDALGHDLSVVTPERVLADELELKGKDKEARRGVGILTVRALPGKGALRGESAILNLGDGEPGKNVLRREAGEVFAFSRAPGGWDSNNYPGSTMGVVAVIRQAFYDARWYKDAQAAYAKHPVGMERPEVNNSWAALETVLNGTTPAVFVTGNVLDLMRADKIGREFGLHFDYLGSGEEYKRLPEVKAAGGKLVIPVDFPEAPDVSTPAKAMGVSTETLRAWDEAPANAAKLHQAGVTFALTANGLKDVGSFRKDVAKAVKAGLPEETALAAVTTVPAGMVGMTDRLGSVDTGKIANLVVADGDLFAEKTKIRSVWVDGNHYDVEEVKPPEGNPAGTWEMTAAVPGGESYPFTLTLEGEPGAITAKLTLMGTEIPADATQSGKAVVVSFDGGAIGVEGTIRFSFEFTGDSANGGGSLPDGTAYGLSGTRTSKPAAAAEPGEGGSR